MNYRNAIVLGAAALTLSAPAMAAETIWLNTGGTSNGWGKTFSNGSTSVDVTAWSVDYDGIIHAATLGAWTAGLGVRNGTGDNSHTVDNVGWTDFLLLQFSSAVEMENAWFTTGWHGMNDTDATIGVGTFSSPLNLAGINAATGVGAFTFFESGSAGKSGNSYRNINSMDLTGNTWIIAASASNPDGFADGFKVKKVTFDAIEAAVPEPGTWALMLLGFGFVGGMMRRNKAQPRVRYAFA